MDRKRGRREEGWHETFIETKAPPKRIVGFSALIWKENYEIKAKEI